MNTFSAKEHFIQSHKDEAAALAEAVNSRWFKESVCFALAVMAASCSTDHMVGARAFVNTLANLGIPDDKLKPSLPDKILKNM